MLLHEDNGFMEAEGIERTHHFTQDKLRKEVDSNTASKVNTKSMFMSKRKRRLTCCDLDVFVRSATTWSLQNRLHP